MLLAALPAQASSPYPWRASVSPQETLAARVPTPPGHRRRDVASGSFAAWLRGLPLKPGRPQVLLHDGRPKANQDAHHAVLDIDTGARDLQQCADAVMRLRAEYLFSRWGDPSAVSFRFTSGHPASLARWFEGQRPRVRGNQVDWALRAAPDASYASFRRYLDVVFTFAGSASLGKELATPPPADLQAGDVFIQGGFPGHAVIVVDVADDLARGRTAFLLAQSYMPAQDMHVLRNPRDPSAGPWYEAPFGEVLETPEWTFRARDRRRFRDPR